MKTPKWTKYYCGSCLNYATKKCKKCHKKGLIDYGFDKSPKYYRIDWGIRINKVVGKLAEW